VPPAVEAVAYAERGEGRSARESARAAGVRNPGKMLLSGGVSGVMSCAGLVSIGQNRTIQASALLACVGEQCLTAAPTNAVQSPRYPSVAIPTRRCPAFASSLTADRAGLHGTHRQA
jgi:hypothetical protein